MASRVQAKHFVRDEHLSSSTEVMEVETPEKGKSTQFWTPERLGQSDDGLLTDESDMSEESGGEDDPESLKDMQKFMRSFSGIESNYRLVKRIGEGKVTSMMLVMDTANTFLQRYLLDSLQSRGS
jgi:hypothetical protein